MDLWWKFHGTTRGNHNTPMLVPDVRAEQVGAGEYHTIIMSDTGDVWACGYNDQGQLGLGSRGNNIYNSRLTQIPDIKATNVAMGRYHMAIVSPLGEVRTCGYNNEGCLGLGNNSSYRVPQLIPNIPAMKQVACGNAHTVMLAVDGTVWTCGWNIVGQLGLGDNNNRDIPTIIPGLLAQQVVAGDSHTVALLIDGSVMSWGRNKHGQLGLGDNVDRYSPTLISDIRAQQVAVGNAHTVMLAVDGGVWTCGRNYAGQLDLGDNVDQDTPTLVQGIPPARQVAAGGDQTMIIL